MSAIQSMFAGYGGTAAGGGSTPDTIGSGLLIWYQNGAGLFQDAAKTTPAVTNDPVGAWEDASGNGRDITVSGTARPTLEAGGAVHCDGSNDNMVTVGGITLKPATLFGLITFDSVAGGFAAVTGFSNALSLSQNGAALRIDMAGVAVIGTSSFTLTAARYRIIITYDASGNYAFYVDGVAAGTGTNDQAIGNVPFGLSNNDIGSYFDGIFWDVGAYDNVLSGGNITALDDYLASI